jgi:hypothetical protein
MRGFPEGIKEVDKNEFAFIIQTDQDWPGID